MGSKYEWLDGSAHERLDGCSKDDALYGGIMND